LSLETGVTEFALRPYFRRHLCGDEGERNLAEIHSNNDAPGIKYVAEAVPSEQATGDPLIAERGAELRLHVVISHLSADIFRIVHFHAAAWPRPPQTVHSVLAPRPAQFTVQICKVIVRWIAERRHKSRQFDSERLRRQRACSADKLL